MSAYLFRRDGLQLEKAEWFGDLEIKKQQLHVVAIRGSRKTGYRIIELPVLPAGPIHEQIANVRLNWAMFSAHRGQFTLPTIDAVRAYLNLRDAKA